MIGLCTKKPVKQLSKCKYEHGSLSSKHKITLDEFICH